MSDAIGMIVDGLVTLKYRQLSKEMRAHRMAPLGENLQDEEIVDCCPGGRLRASGRLEDWDLNWLTIVSLALNVVLAVGLIFALRFIFKMWP